MAFADYLPSGLKGYLGITTSEVATQAGSRAVVAGSQVITGSQSVLPSSFLYGVSMGLSVHELYATQPHLRTVVAFVARNAANIDRKVNAKAADGTVSEAATSPFAAILKRPNDYQSGYDLFNQLFTELALYDMALWTISKSAQDGRTTLECIPMAWVQTIQRDAFNRPLGYIIQPPLYAEPQFIPADAVVAFRGYHPEGLTKGSSAVLALKSTLREQIAAANFRQQMWARGGRVGAFLSRPANAPAWSEAAKSKFVQDWRESWAGDGSSAGATPLLEDGITMQRIGFSAKDEQWLEAATLSMTTVAAAYHVPPAMVGVSGYNSFASVQEYHKMLYTETLGPSLEQVEETINAFLLPFLGEPAGNYFHMDIDSKMRGDFQQEAAVTSTAVGGPWMTRNEARKRLHLAPVEGGDDLITPLNVIAGGQSSPQDGGAASGNQDLPADQGKALAAEVHTKAAAPGDLESALIDYYTDMRAELNKKYVKASGESPLDIAKWNKKLSAQINGPVAKRATQTARTVTKQLGKDPDDYEPALTVNYTRAITDRTAASMNTTTAKNFLDAMANAKTPADAIKQMFGDGPLGTLAASYAQNITQNTDGWATKEAVAQAQLSGTVTKTWVTGDNPRELHAAMDGETVDIDDEFSNGSDFPGDFADGPEGSVNCNCTMTVTHTAN